uniref:Lkrsdh1 n=1 Tax=Arundo donax TaxID=35708 RepID=A0A0A9FU69_ARUDO
MCFINHLHRHHVVYARIQAHFAKYSYTCNFSSLAQV